MKKDTNEAFFNRKKCKLKKQGCKNSVAIVTSMLPRQQDYTKRYDDFKCLAVIAWTVLKLFIFLAKGALNPSYPGLKSYIGLR